MTSENDCTPDLRATSVRFRACVEALPLPPFACRRRVVALASAFLLPGDARVPFPSEVVLKREKYVFI